MTKANGRRLNGEGTINKVNGRNLYRGRVWVRGTNGELKHVQKYGKTRGEVRDKINEAKREAEAGLTHTTPETVAEYYDQWAETALTRKGSKPRPKTIENRKFCGDKMRPYIGSIKLKELRRFHIKKMYEELGCTDRLSNNSIRRVHSWLKRALSVAVEDKILADNPASNVTPPSPEKKDMETLDKSEVRALLSRDDEWTPLFTTLVGTGLRIGEALALRWSDVDLDTGEIRVRRTLGRVGKKLVFGEPKTDKSRREIPLPQHGPVISALKNQLGLQLNKNNVIDLVEHKAAMKKLASDDLVFPNNFGQPMEQSTPYHALKRSIRQIAGGISDDDPKAKKRWGHLVKTLRVHDLRHTAATLMHMDGVDPKEIQETLGHATIQITYDLYIHTSPEKKREALDILGQAIATAV